ncbi:transmembrane protein 127-like [Lytechinus pictus]|uniref:transmembrane protein 127-like n=1 Tax=Lytechinus pictus TaxID=7653 RepID=UPI00240D2E4D|nr:transmembrane protein 127-like [Lytechinus pictus]
MPSSGRTSGSSSRRSRSNHSHHHHRHRRRHRLRPKQTERNLVASILGMVVIAVLISALADRKWFRLHGGKCKQEYLGAYQFLTPNIENMASYQYCFTSKAIPIMRAVIGFLFLGIVSSLVAFFLDTLGPMQTPLKLCRRFAISSIVTVLFCVAINGFCYWVSTCIEEELKAYKLVSTSKVYVTFEMGYYLVVVSGALSVVISATNLLRRYPLYDEPQRRERLVEDWDELLEQELPGFPPNAALTAPPAYTP